MYLKNNRSSKIIFHNNQIFHYNNNQPIFNNNKY